MEIQKKMILWSSHLYHDILQMFAKFHWGKHEKDKGMHAYQWPTGVTGTFIHLAHKPILERKM